MQGSFWEHQSDFNQYIQNLTSDICLKYNLFYCFFIKTFIIFPLLIDVIWCVCVIHSGSCIFLSLLQMHTLFCLSHGQDLEITSVAGNKLHLAKPMLCDCPVLFLNEKWYSVKLLCVDSLLSNPLGCQGLYIKSFFMLSNTFEMTSVCWDRFS